MQKIHIGTSGFYYDHWIGRCYPDTISKHDLLPFFAQHFKTVEINSTFYHLPRRSTIEHWLETTPDDFIFTLKANRSITHRRRLDAALKEVMIFIHLIKPLKKKLGVILFQLPPYLKLDIGLLDAFISQLPKGYKYAIEFRDVSWMDDVVFELMELHGIGFCINDFEQRQTPRIATAPFAYIRMHGPQGRYRGKYDAQSIRALCETIHGFVKEGREVFCYFNNDMEGFAWQNAQELVALCRSSR
ncbi:DUF72 domain-containing protein [Sulfurimonas sp. HSL3-7]|uniref:DUF72 domain-containing protein n=1 Tax=Sulfonitrofixus jiaomeiensis TaxID=3131938 RepID=UPI0031F8D67E